jgi:hypothetical protein
MARTFPLILFFSMTFSEISACVRGAADTATQSPSPKLSWQKRQNMEKVNNQVSSGSTFEAAKDGKGGDSPQSPGISCACPSLD